MKLKKWIAIGLGLTALLVTVTAVSLAAAAPAVPEAPAEATAPVTRAVASATSDNGTFDDYYKKWQYTQADYDFVAALNTKGYESLSVAEFNTRLMDWKDEDAFHKGSERIDRLLQTYPDDKPNAQFIDNTIRASYDEISTHHYGGSCTRTSPSFWDYVERVRNEDVFGDQMPVFTAGVGYRIEYRIKDESALTVGERDGAIQAFREGIQAYLEGKSEQDLKNEKTMRTGLTKALAELDKKLSTDNFKLTTTLDDYDAEDYRDWY